MATVVLLGTLDTKSADFRFLEEELRGHGVDVLIVDAGTDAPEGIDPKISAEDLARAGGVDLEQLRAGRDRGSTVTAMGRAAAVVVRGLHQDGRLDALLSAGGSGNSSIAAAAMAALPIGVPKLLVSTLASGDVAPFVGAKDVAIMYSVVDVAGINRISRVILGNAAAAAAGMARHHADQRSGPTAGPADRPVVAATMFGVTTTAVQVAQRRLEDAGFEVLVFHATGAGGRSLEALAQDGLLDGVLDLTTTEVADEICGGVLSAGPERLRAAGAAGIPQVVAPGALDMANFGPIDTVPDRYADRNLYVHNPAITLMRTTAAEMTAMGEFIARALAKSIGPVEVFWPLGGVSALDAPGEVFADAAADAAGLDALEKGLAGTQVLVHRRDEHINDPSFALAMADRLIALIEERQAES